MAIAAIAFVSMGSLGCMRKPVAEAVVTPPPPPVLEPHREPIYFIKGDASLSPGAMSKLQNWAQSWGTKGTWTLACPTNRDITYDLLGRRIQALRAELGKLGAKNFDSHLVFDAPAGPYDPIFIEMDPAKTNPAMEPKRYLQIVRPVAAAKVSVKAKKKARLKPQAVAAKKKPKQAPVVQIAKLSVPK